MPWLEITNSSFFTRSGALDLTIHLMKTKKAFDSKQRVGYQIYKEALKCGLVLRPLGNVLYFNPPLIIENAEIEKAIEKTKQAMTAILG